MPEEATISIDDVALIVSDLDYDVDRRNDHMLVLTNEAGVKIVAVLQGQVVVFTVNLMKTSGTIDQFIAQNRATVANMLTSSHDVNAKYVLAEADGKVLINLTESVKLMACGEDDKDDISHALSTLEQDALIDSRNALEALA